jgi:hypothetical protein
MAPASKSFPSGIIHTIKPGDKLLCVCKKEFTPGSFAAHVGTMCEPWAKKLAKHNAKCAWAEAVAAADSSSDDSSSDDSFSNDHAPAPQKAKAADTDSSSDDLAPKKAKAASQKAKAKAASRKVKANAASRKAKVKAASRKVKAKAASRKAMRPSFSC